VRAVPFRSRPASGTVALAMVKPERVFRGGPSGRRFAGVLVGLGLLLASGSAQATKVKGKVTGHTHLLNPVWAEARDAKRHLYSFREPVPTVRAEFRQLFPHIPKELCVVALATEKLPAKEPILIRVGGGRTTPVTIVVTPGTQLQFQNTDPFSHRLYGVDIDDFKASDTVKGGVRSWTVPKAGSYEIRDEAAPSLRMWVIAEENAAAIAYPSLKGEFILTVPEPGSYEVQAYFAGKKVGPAQQVQIDQRETELKTPLVVAKKGDTKSDDKD
jgi:plastocyanin